MRQGAKRPKRQKTPFETIANGMILRDGATFDTEPRFRTLLLKGFIVYLVVMGSLGCLLSSFKIPYNALVIHVAVLIGALFSAFLYYTKVWENLGYFVLFAFMLGTALVLRRYISSGFFAVVNIISERAAYYFDTEVVQGYAESIGNRGVTVTIAMVYVGWVFAILLNALISRQMKYFAVMFTAFFFLVVPMYLEREPDMLYILMLMAGCLIVFVFRGARHTPIKKDDQRFEYVPKKRHFNYVYASRHHMVIVGMLIALVLLFAGVFQLFVKKTDFELASLRGRSAWKISTENTVENLYKNGIWGLFNRYESIGGLKGGVLGGVSSVNIDYETDLEVTYVPYSAERMYLRTFTGAEYRPFENRWQRAEKYLVMQEPKLSADGKNRTYEGIRLNEATTSATAHKLRKRYEKREPMSAKARMEIKNIAAGLGTFLPYYVDETDGSSLQMMNYRQVFELTYFPWLTDPGKADVSDGNIEDTKAKRTSGEIVYGPSGKRVGILLEGSRYLTVPKENQQVIDDFIHEARLEKYKADAVSSMEKAAAADGDAGGGAAADSKKAEQLLQALGAYFQENIPYTYQPGTTPSKTDFINYFLGDNKRGYCAHFASAATLILRRLGYAARYVEGYAIDPTDMDQDAKVRNDLLVKDYYDGDMLINGESKVVTVNVTDAMAHAWVEVKIDGHWRVAELTPWSEEEPPTGGFLKGLIDFLSGVSVGGGRNEVGSDDAVGGGVGLDTFGRVMGYVILALFIVVAIGAFLFVVTRFALGRVRHMRADRSDRLVIEFHRASHRVDKRLAKRLAKKMAGTDIPSSVRAGDLERESAAGHPAETINYRERVRAMEKLGKLDLSREEQDELIRILERAGFSGREISSDEYEKARQLLKKR